MSTIIPSLFISSITSCKIFAILHLFLLPNVTVGNWWLTSPNVESPLLSEGIDDSVPSTGEESALSDFNKYFENVILTTSSNPHVGRRNSC